MKQNIKKKGVMQGAVIQRIRSNQGQEMPDAVQKRHF